MSDYRKGKNRKENSYEKEADGLKIEGRNAVIEAFRSKKTIDKVYIQDGLHDGPISTVVREAKKVGSIIEYVPKERLDGMSETNRHQGVIAKAAAYSYSEVEDILAKAKEKGEDPFIFILDNIEDPHNRSTQLRSNYKDSQSLWCSWGNYSKTQVCRTYSNSCKDFSRGY